MLYPDGGGLPDVVFDGFVDESKYVDGEPLAENRICVQQPGAEVLNADGSNDFAGAQVDTEAYDCVLEPLGAVALDLS